MGNEKILNLCDKMAEHLKKSAKKDGELLALLCPEPATKIVYREELSPNRAQRRKQNR